MECSGGSTRGNEVLDASGITKKNVRMRVGMRLSLRFLCRLRRGRVGDARFGKRHVVDARFGKRRVEEVRTNSVNFNREFNFKWLKFHSLRRLNLICSTLSPRKISMWRNCTCIFVATMLVLFVVLSVGFTLLKVEISATEN